ncbi:hypothetical protein [Granulicella sp. S156]|jgi:hypothetical protein|uniref:hypothetical protein n=1 Tax=Granulicella sp. S156 TaxID=1747224 RepID=UPI00131DA3CB|nr:hypothetical protein [Granulicella sp. S156]
MTDQSSPHKEAGATEPARASRLSKSEYAPWIQAETLVDCGLFWLPVSGFPMTHDEKAWLSEFARRIGERFEQREKLRTEIFLQFKTLVDDSLNAFIRYRQRSSTLIGLGRYPNAQLPPMPTEQQIREMRERKEPFDYREWVGDYTYWFIMKQPEKQRELFSGLGGMTTIFLPPDPKTRAPKMPFTPKLRAAHPVFQRFDVDAAHQALYSMGDAFLEKSKKMFGDGLQDSLQYDGLAFVLPLLDTGHFFAATAEQRAEWFQLFGGYLRESPHDKGILFACKDDPAEVLAPVTESMKQDGLRFPLELHA